MNSRGVCAAALRSWTRARSTYYFYLNFIATTRSKHSCSASENRLCMPSPHDDSKEPRDLAVTVFITVTISYFDHMKKSKIEAQPLPRLLTRTLIDIGLKSFYLSKCKYQCLDGDCHRVNYRKSLGKSLNTFSPLSWRLEMVKAAGQVRPIVGCRTCGYESGAYRVIRMANLGPNFLLPGRRDMLSSLYVQDEASGH